MNVGDLIDHLSRFERDMDVVIEHYDTENGRVWWESDVCAPELTRVSGKTVVSL